MACFGFLVTLFLPTKYILVQKVTKKAEMNLYIQSLAIYSNHGPQKLIRKFDIFTYIIKKGKQL
ncbi:hypothetical protein CVD23_07165 [Bacillus sp. V33-4]|nr:hypothetical protein CVD23_07165 [Bacillus sp. V33-4]